MPLLAILTDTAHAALDDSLKGLYVQNPNDKQFYIDIAADEAAKVAFNLQDEKNRLVANNSDLLRQKGEANNKLKAFTDLGKTPEELQKLALGQGSDVKELEAKHAQEKAALQTSFDEALKAQTAKTDKYSSDLAASMVSAEISKLRATHQLEDVADYILKDFIRAVPKDDDSGDFELQVFENGQRSLVAGAGKTPDQLIKDFQTGNKFAAMFTAGNGGGTGDTSRSDANNSVKGTIRAGDQEALNANLEGIAAGTIRVTD